MKLGKVIALVLGLGLAGCLPEDSQAPLSILVHEYDFKDSDHGWVADFAEYPAGQEAAAEYELNAAYTDDVATESVISRRSFMLSGKSINGDLFMYIKKKVGGLMPNTNYTVTFNVDLASEVDVTERARSVYLKAGATYVEPKSLIEDGYYRLNIDKGNHGSPGEDMIVLGDILGSSKSSHYVLLNLNNTMAQSRYVARTNGNGEIWLIVGLDSASQGGTTVFLRKVQVIFSAS